MRTPFLALVHRGWLFVVEEYLLLLSASLLLLLTPSVCLLPPPAVNTLIFRMQTTGNRSWRDVYQNYTPGQVYLHFDLMGKIESASD